MKQKDNIDKYFYYLEQLPNEKYFPLSLISRKISILMTLREAINANPSGLEASYKKAIESNNLKDYGAPLLDYVILEIRNFYYCTYSILGEKTPLPKYYAFVKTFRDEIVGHFKKPDNKKIAELYKMLNQIGFEQIYADWLESKERAYKILDENNKTTKAPEISNNEK